MSKPLKLVSVLIAMLLLVEPAFANPIMPGNIQPINTTPAIFILSKPKITFRENLAGSGVSYDSLNRLSAIQNQGGAAITGYSYDTLSRRTTTAAANSTGTTYSYDNLNRLSNLSNTGGGGAISTFGYSYDSVGNRLSKTTAAGTETYGYDNLNQLTSVQYPTAAAFPNTGFNYDPLGNRTTMTNGAATT